MSQQTVTISLEIPDGYQVIAYRVPEDGESFLDIKGRVLAQDEDSNYGCTYFILEKTHKSPELIYCLQTFDSDFRTVETLHDTAPVEKLGEKYRYFEDEYDLIIAEHPRGTKSVWLGHWNDGIKTNEP